VSVPGVGLVLRADANRTIGAGHAMRLAALGAAWRAAGGRVRSVGLLGLDFVAAHYHDQGIAGSDREPADSEIVVVDSYDPGCRFEMARTTSPVLRVLVDDLGGSPPAGYEVIWNPSPYGSAELYWGFGGTVLAGIGRLAVRADLPRWTGGSGELVVSLGGATPAAPIQEALEQLARMAPETRFAITGSWGPDQWRRIDPGAFWAETARAKALIVGAGSSVWEAAAVGVPVILLEVAANQRLTYRWARDAGVPGLKTSLVDSDFLAHQLRALLPAARPLPPVRSGTARVASELAGLAAARMASR
jgi:hypothetical protein